MYQVFIYRLYYIYSDSSFAYNVKILFILFIITIIHTLCLVIINIFTLKFNVDTNINNQTVCTVKGNSFLILVTIVFDMILSSLCCYLFIRPLLIFVI